MVVLRSFTRAYASENSGCKSLSSSSLAVARSCNVSLLTPIERAKPVYVGRSFGLSSLMILSFPFRPYSSRAISRYGSTSKNPIIRSTNEGS